MSLPRNMMFVTHWTGLTHAAGGLTGGPAEIRKQIYYYERPPPQKKKKILRVVPTTNGALTRLLYVSYGYSFIQYSVSTKSLLSALHMYSIMLTELTRQK